VTRDVLDLADLRHNAAAACAMLRSLAHEDRLLLLCRLAQDELCVSELEAELDIRQPSLSQQLGVLRREGLVATRRAGRHIYYRIADPRAGVLLETLHALYCDTEGGSR